jgi:dTDP-4-amino-4,6-dideoxygalactose transaminase
MATVPVMKPWIGAEEAQAAAEAVSSGWVAQGPRVGSFERAFAELVGAADAVALSSCTAALHLSMVLLNVGRGDEVVVPSLSFVATANAARYVGATPVFADVDEKTQNLTAETIEPVLTRATRAVILVHQAGIPADVDEIHKLCDPRGIEVVEDAACAIGSRIGDRLVGSDSDLVTFSFHPRKLVTTGEGGMLVCGREEDAVRARQLREHGMSVSAADRHQSGRMIIEEYLETGFNYRMTDIQAAVGLVQLAKLEHLVARRRELAARYVTALGDIPGIVMAGDPPHGRTNFQSFWVLLPPESPLGRDDLLAGLLADGISARRGIMAAHLEPAYSGHEHAALPVTERLTRDSVILPLFHTMTDQDQERVIDCTRRRLCGS